MRLSQSARFWSKVANLGGKGCWPWVGAKTNLGYGTTSVARRTLRVHRLAYSWLIGPIPPGLHIDHLCRNRACVRPSHLEVVTNKVNVRRGVGLTAQNAAKTHCIRGHELSPENIRSRPDRPERRECRICHREWSLGRSISGRDILRGEALALSESRKS